MMKRFHQNRMDASTRDKLAETNLTAADFIPALFIVEDPTLLARIPGLDGTWHVGLDRLAYAIVPLLELGIDKILLFGVPDESAKSPNGHAAWENDPLVSRAVRRIKTDFPAMTVMTDVCLCAYTDHGHCGLIPDSKGLIDNDATLPLLAAMALSHARAGADWVAPSAMMDGQVHAIRQELDRNGFKDKTKVLGYSAKFASAFYGPFRGAAASTPGFGDRKSYQMDPRNGREALEEIQTDLDEGAQAVMVKPALTYLDIIARARDKWPDTKLAAYHTSGEYMATKAAATAGVLDGPRALSEQLHAIKRAGADWIITYAAEEYLEKSKQHSV